MARRLARPPECPHRLASPTTSLPAGVQPGTPKRAGSSQAAPGALPRPGASTGQPILFARIGSCVNLRPRAAKAKAISRPVTTMTKKPPLLSNELTELIAGLNRLARNLWWTWNQESQEIFQELSPRGWQNLYHNAVAVLHEVSDYELRVRLQDPDFADRVRIVLKTFDEYLKGQNTWGREHAPALIENPVAYFTAEFGFHETLPIAAGGLGMLAGDHAKSASDLGLGFVGISLFYREGYFQQSINHDNWQVDYYTQLNPKNLPLEPVLGKTGEPLVCHVELGMDRVAFQIWRANVGRVSVYLLDCDRKENERHFRDLTLRVYGGDSTTRIMQET